MAGAGIPRGFTLIELIMVIVLLGIIGGITTAFITRPMQGYVDMQRRAALTERAELALRRIARDIRRALPNSIRVTAVSPTRTAIEMLNTVEGMRYRDEPPGGSNPRLEFNAADTDWDVFGNFQTLTFGGQPAGFRVVVFHLGIAGADAYAGDAVITPGGTTITTSDDPNRPDEDHFNLSLGHQFPFQSPDQRMFVIDGPISYVCDTTAEELTRHEGYAIQAVQPTDPNAAPLLAVRKLVSDRVTTCTMTYQPGATQRAGLVTISIRVQEDTEFVELLHQVHVDNVP